MKVPQKIIMSKIQFVGLKNSRKVQYMAITPKMTDFFQTLSHIGKNNAYDHSKEN